MSQRKERKIVQPKDASTVMLLRQSPNTRGEEIEVLMVLRHPDNKFVANSYVYPGGALDDEDFAGETEALCRDMNREKALGLMRDIPPEKAVGAWVAGIRETFEEVGLLLAYEKNGDLISFNRGEKKRKFTAYRDALCRGSGSFIDMLVREGLTLATDRLHYFSHWITPEALPIRYDVRFFVAAAPERQEALHDGCELIEHVWVTPREALEAYRQCRFGLVLPTIMTLQELCSFKAVEDVIRASVNKTIPRILTRMARKGGRDVEIMPDGTDFGPSPC